MIRARTCMSRHVGLRTSYVRLRNGGRREDSASICSAASLGSARSAGLIFFILLFPVLETQRARTKMADTAAFFAKKKKKGKKKAFNANLVDIAAVTSSTHV